MSHDHDGTNELSQWLFGPAFKLSKQTFRVQHFLRELFSCSFSISNKLRFKIIQISSFKSEYRLIVSETTFVFVYCFSTAQVVW